MCNGDWVTACNTEGSGPLDDGIDCSRSGLLCWAGDCLARICAEPFECRNGALYRCANRGSALVLEESCGAGTVCDAIAGACRLQDCEPGQPTCDGPIATTCDANGTGYEGARTDCSASALACAEGTCMPVICVPNERYCDGSELRHCGPSGATFEVLDACEPSEYCNPAQPLCMPDTCTAGAPICNGTHATTCAADGSGPVAGGTDCTLSQQSCDRGMCRTTVCAPNERECSDSTSVSLCNALGTASTPIERCGPGEHCQEGEGGASCQQNICNPNENACHGERIALCNSSGSGYASELTDCGPTRLLCDANGQCVSTVAESIAASGQPVSTAPSYHFILVRPLTSRQLSSFAMRLGLPTATDLTCLLYHSDNFAGPYVLVRQGVRNAGATAMSGELIASTGLVGPLPVGGYYLIGMGISTPHTVFRDVNAQLTVLSFAQVLGSFTLASSPFPEPARPAPSFIQIGANDVDVGLGSAFTTVPF